MAVKSVKICGACGNREEIDCGGVATVTERFTWCNQAIGEVEDPCDGCRRILITELRATFEETLSKLRPE